MNFYTLIKANRHLYALLLHEMKHVSLSNVENDCVVLANVANVVRVTSVYH